MYEPRGYFIGLVIEAATGNPCYDEIRTRFLTPFKLTLTTPSDRRFLPGLASGYMSMPVIEELGIGLVKAVLAGRKK